MVFLLDPSYTIGQANFTLMIEFIKNTIDTLHIGTDGVQIGVVKIGTRPSILMHLNQYNTKDLVIKAVENVPFSSHYTNIEGRIVTKRFMK